MNEIAVIGSALFIRDCSFPVRDNPGRTALSCRGDATSGVIDPDTGHRLWRCDFHRGLVRDGVTGHSFTRVQIIDHGNVLSIL